MNNNDDARTASNTKQTNNTNATNNIHRITRIQISSLTLALITGIRLTILITTLTRTTLVQPMTRIAPQH